MPRTSCRKPRSGPSRLFVDIAEETRAWAPTIVRNTSYSWLSKNCPHAVVLTEDLDQGARDRASIRLRGRRGRDTRNRVDRQGRGRTDQQGGDLPADAIPRGAGASRNPRPRLPRDRRRGATPDRHGDVAPRAGAPAAFGRRKGSAASISQDDELLVTAYLDGELGPLEATRFEQRLAPEPALDAAIEAYHGSRARSAPISTKTCHRKPPTGFARRGISPAPSQSPVAEPRRVLRDGRAAGRGADLRRPPSAGKRGDRRPNGIGAYPRTDGASADRRRLLRPSHDKALVQRQARFRAGRVGPGEPWIPTLAGARIDVIGLQPVATLVYSHGRHVISLTEMPSLEPLSQAVRQYREHGYLALSWSDGQIAYWAVSDTTPDELESFVRLFRAAAAGF